MEILISNSMYAEHLKSDDRLTLLMNKVAEINSFNSTEENLNGVFWTADHFKLSQSKIFKSLSNEKQFSILSKLSHLNISLAYYIEKFGLNYGAKMIATAESVEEKSLYTLFSADETRHRLLIENYLAASVPADIKFHPLLPALELCLETGTKEAMVYTIQVLLEGFGIYHYGYLRDSTVSESLKKSLNIILKDEASHHGMGLILSERMSLNSETNEQILDLTSLFIKSLLDANWVTQVTEEVCEGFTSSQLIQFQNEINYHEQLNQRKIKLKYLLSKNSNSVLYDFSTSQIFKTT